MKGESNPNFGNRWDDEQKQKASQMSIKKFENPETRYKCGNANRGKKFSKERCENISKGHKGILLGRKLNEDRKIQIGIASAKKFTPEYKEKFRKRMEEDGHWVPLKDKNDWDVYKDLSNWKQRMFDLITDKNQLQLLNEHGVFNSWKNNKGIVRDHMYSRKSGFINGVFPEILRHPCNCQLLTHADNTRKKSSRYVDADTISLNELFNLILDYKKDWTEQSLCVKLIKDYQNNKRWSKGGKHL